jgi:hypothetical protein
MTFKQLVPVGRLGERVRKALIAGVSWACTDAAWYRLRDPAFDGWTDTFTWPQLFLFAPVLFFSGAAVWQLICLIAEWSYRAAKRELESAESKESHDIQRTLKFWLRDSVRICALYVATCLIGDIPMAVNYLAGVRGRPFHWWWSSAVGTCAVVMVVVWWILDRTFRTTHATVSGVLDVRNP